MTVAAVLSTSSPPGSPGPWGRRALRERSRLPLPLAARRLKRLGQPLKVTPQAIALAFQPRVLVTQALTFLARMLNLSAQPLQFSLGVVDRLRSVAAGHATVMADSRKKYKSKLWIGPLNPLTNYVA
jgi:hypothetical protein